MCKCYLKTFTRKILLLTLVFLVGEAISMSANTMDSLRKELDLAIANRKVYLRQKRASINKIRDELNRSANDEARYWSLGRLSDAYKSYDLDSSLYYAYEKMTVAQRLNRIDFIDDAKMNIAEARGMNGMYKEALDLMKTVNKKHLKDYQIGYYYNVYKATYDFLKDNRYDQSEKDNYERMSACYRDSLIFIAKSDPILYTILIAGRYNSEHKYKQAIEAVNKIYEKARKDLRTQAVLDYTYAQSYKGMGDRQRQKEHLYLSAICDIKTGVREYTSLRQLAVLCYEDGDIEQAYRYLTICMDDAVDCNSRWRIFEVQEVFPLINKAYHHNLSRQRTIVDITLIIISLLSAFLAIALTYIYRQMRKVAQARKDVQKTNEQLKKINTELAESSYIKEKYIGHYIGLCSVYIQKLENYRKHLYHIATKGKPRELMTGLRSTQFINEELKEFYNNFDETFLNLFPDFIENFNKLLIPEGRIHLKPGEKMNTELRIFALVRLGITSSQKIASFLRYSVTTIYNYRVKIRNNAAVNREDFEKEVMKIGKIKK